MMPDQASVDGRSRCDGIHDEVRIAVAFVFGGITNWQRRDIPLEQHFRMFFRVDIKAYVRLVR